MLPDRDPPATPMATARSQARTPSEVLEFLERYLAENFHRPIPLPPAIDVLDWATASFPVPKLLEDIHSSVSITVARRDIKDNEATNSRNAEVRVNTRDGSHWTLRPGDVPIFYAAPPGQRVADAPEVAMLGWVAAADIFATPPPLAVGIDAATLWLPLGKLTFLLQHRPRDTALSEVAAAIDMTLCSDFSWPLHFASYSAQVKKELFPRAARGLCRPERVEQCALLMFGNPPASPPDHGGGICGTTTTDAKPEPSHLTWLLRLEDL